MPVNVIPVLAQSKRSAETNAKVLDHVSAARVTRNSDTKPSQPISKQILTAIFSSRTNHVFIDNEQDNHFLYGLVLPLVARVLAVSTPGLVVVVQLPRPDIVPEWAIPTYDEYPNASKSAAPTTPSPHDTSRTPSPSDEIPTKSFSPTPRVSEQLIRHADNVLSAETLAERENLSPPPDSVVQDNAALRLICNGFEVLTGKMPPPSYHMGQCTLASVAWEKAGVLEPPDPTKGLSMSFSNGMMTPTDGIVVTFSNGSLCLLTTRDPLSGLDSLKISEETPVVVFSFAAVSYASVAELRTIKSDNLSPVATKVRRYLEKSNFFFVEIGHSAAVPSATSTETPDSQRPRRENNVVNQNRNDVNNVKSFNCPPILITSVPRAIPLFVNTITQTFIDPPHDYAENYEPDVVNDRFREQPEPTREQAEPRRGSSSDEGKRSDEPPRRDNTATKKEESGRKEVAAFSSALETIKPSAAMGSQSTKPLPPVDKVVRRSQSLPARQGHYAPVYNYPYDEAVRRSRSLAAGQGHYAPPYNYPYPQNHMHTSNSQNHVLPHHVPSMHQGQSMGNPYYISPHTNGHTGHPAQYPPEYPHNGYYAQHVVPSRDNWHRVPQYGLPPHPLDARRDMPAQFAHRTDGQYGASYYPTQHGEMYASQHMGVVSGAVPREMNRVRQQSPQSGVPSAPTTSTPMADPVHRPSASGDLSGGNAGNLPQDKKPVNATDGRKKAHALEALANMGSREREGSAEGQTRRTNDDNVEGGEQGRSFRGDVGRVRSPMKRSRRTETSSSTSTNSGGGALLNGAVVGHSHATLPQRKRRKR